MKYRHIKKWILLAGIVLSAVASHFSGAINSYYLQIVIFIGINITLAVSLNLINGFTGQFSIGHAGFMAVGAYGAAMFTVQVGEKWVAAMTSGGVPAGIAQGTALLIALVIGGLLAALAGYLVGL